MTIVAPAAPGGLYSLFARLIGSKLEQRLGKPFIVENRPGASSIVGAMSVIRAPHDGYTLMVGNTSGFATNVSLHKNLPYDPVKDFAPIALIARIPEVLVVNAALPVHSLADLAKLAKATPGGLTYGSAGAGTAQHLSGVLLASVLGVELTHVPYKGMQPAINDVAGGHIPFMFSPIPFAQPLAQAGKLRMLGVTTAQRIEAIPEVRAADRDRAQGVRRGDLVHAGGGGRHAARHRRKAAPGGAGHHRRSAGADGAHPARPPAGAIAAARRASALYRGRNRALGRYREEGRDGGIAIGRRGSGQAMPLFGPDPFDK